MIVSGGKSVASTGGWVWLGYGLDRSPAPKKSFFSSRQPQFPPCRCYPQSTTPTVRTTPIFGRSASSTQISLLALRNKTKDDHLVKRQDGGPFFWKAAEIGIPPVTTPSSILCLMAYSVPEARKMRCQPAPALHLACGQDTHRTRLCGSLCSRSLVPRAQFISVRLHSPAGTEQSLVGWGPSRPPPFVPPNAPLS